MAQVVAPEAFTVFVNPATPINELMDALVKATGCRMGNVDVPWQALDSKTCASECSSVEMKMRLAVGGQDYSLSEAPGFISAYDGGECRPANTRELLVFLATYVKEQLRYPEYPVVAFGEHGDERGPIVAYAYISGQGDRMLYIGRPSDTCKWEAGCRFLVVKK